MATINEIIKIGQVEIRFLLQSNDTNGQMAVFEFTVPPASRVPLPHYHELYDETVYGLEGQLSFNINGQEKLLNKGETIFIKRGDTHGFMNTSNQPAKVLAVVTPALIGPEFFRESAAIVNAGGPPDMEKMKLVFKKYNIVPVFPAQ